MGPSAPHVVAGASNTRVTALTDVVRAGIQEWASRRSITLQRKRCTLLSFSHIPSGSRLCQHMFALSMEQQNPVLTPVTKLFHLALPVAHCLTQVKE